VLRETKMMIFISGGMEGEEREERKEKSEERR
jgi:hypothetical protein